jgi:hypothetical protein
MLSKVGKFFFAAPDRTGTDNDTQEPLCLAIFTAGKVWTIHVNLRLKSIIPLGSLLMPRLEIRWCRYIKSGSHGISRIFSSTSACSILKLWQGFKTLRR